MTNKYKLVQIEPTSEMYLTGQENSHKCVTDIYRAMLEAAPPADVGPLKDIVQNIINNSKDLSVEDKKLINDNLWELYETSKEDVEPVAEKLWLWKNGDHYLAYRNEYPCESQGGDPLTLGEPVGYAILKESFSRDTKPPADATTKNGVGFYNTVTGELKSVITSDDGDISEWVDVCIAPADVEPVAWRVGQFWSSSTPHEIVLCLAKDKATADEWEKRKDFIKWESHPPADKDAERYRWLKERAFLCRYGWVFKNIKYHDKPTTVDEAIDKAMGE